MRSILALVMAFPFWYLIFDSSSYFLIPFAIGIQLLAGANFKLGR